MRRDARIWLKIIPVCLVPGKHVTHVMTKTVCLVFSLMTERPVNVRVIIKDVLRRERVKERVKKGKIFSFEGLLTRFMIDQQIDEEVVDHRTMLRMSGVTEEQLQQLNMNYPLSEHSRALYRVGPGFEEPINYDDTTNEE
ncbi:hypothetical protein HAX54_041436 [Datura stramonium]|uniref:Uncharacterized protein n=1 Tax=Datura stramonium TaxID=4076 RepID=A0ABS8SL80_DATST|nr:hypothetical protein [Datura stramonium]